MKQELSGARIRLDAALKALGVALAEYGGLTEYSLQQRLTQERAEAGELLTSSLSGSIEATNERGESLLAAWARDRNGPTKATVPEAELQRSVLPSNEVGMNSAESFQQATGRAAGRPATGPDSAEAYWREVLQEAPPHLVWQELLRRGGLDAAYAEGALLAAEKSKDYNGDRSRDEYFPFGALSYAQMLHVKTLRVVSLARKQLAGGVPTFEGIADSILDLMNYAAFGVERMRREEKGE